MNLPEKQLDVVDLTRSIRDQYFNLQLANQELNLKYTAALKENEQLKQEIEKLQHFISVSRN